MSALNQTEFVTKAIGSGDASVVSDAFGTTITMAQAIFIPMFTSGSSVTPTDALVRSQLTSTTQATWYKQTSGQAQEGAGYVIEFAASGCTIERGTSIGSASEGTRDITLAGTPDLTKTFLIWSSTNAGNTYGLDDNVFAYLWDDAGTIKIHVGDNGSGGTADRDIEWQVCTLDDCLVARYSDTGMASGDATEVQAITAITRARTFMTASFTMGDDSGGQLGEMAMSARFNSTTEVQSERDSTGVAADDIRYEIVQLSADWSGEDVISTQAASTGSENVTVTSAVVANSFVIGNMRYNMGNGNYGSDDELGDFVYVAEQTTTTNVNVRRGASLGSGDFVGRIMTYTAPVAGGGQTTPILSYQHRMV